jgi:tetratricopeptide (TPR) repeat protein
MKLNLVFSISLSFAVCACISTLPSRADEYSIAVSKYNAGNFAEAQQHFAKAAQSQPKSWKVQYQLANTQLQLKQIDKAKKSYQKCISLNPPADTRAQCERAISYLNNPPQAAAPPAYRPSMYSRPSSSPSSADAGPSSGDREKEAARARITREAEAEIAKMKQEEEERFKAAEASSNRAFIHQDGSIKYELSDAEEAEFKKEVARKEAAIRERMQRQLNSIR